MKNISFVEISSSASSLKNNNYGDNKTDLILDNIDEPDFESRGLTAAANICSEACIWDAPISHSMQVELMQVLKRVMEQLYWSSMSIRQSRPFDAACIILPGCIAAIADSILRRKAFDHPSEVCSHLMGQTRSGRQLGISGFGLDVKTFAEQSETLEVHAPELNFARAAVLDYFQSPSQRLLTKFMTWGKEYKLTPGRPLMEYLRNVCRELGIKEALPYNLLIDGVPMYSRLFLNYSELHCYRDINFFWQHLLNPDIKSFLNYCGVKGKNEIRRLKRMQSQLVWRWDRNSYVVQIHGRNIFCAPAPNQKSKDGKKLTFTHRFPSTAKPSFYTKEEVNTEDDIIYLPNLPSFEDEVKSALGMTKKTSVMQKLGQRDSELLLSYLTVPYIRIPLVLTFFTTNDRIHKLALIKLRDILDSVMFEPGRFLSIECEGGVAPKMVPTRHQKLLASPYGLLFNELLHSPTVIVTSTLNLLESAITLDTGSVSNSDTNDFNINVQIIFYALRFGCRVDNYLSVLIRIAKGSYQGSTGQLRGFQISPHRLKELESGRAKLFKMLNGSYHNLLEDYLYRLQKQVDTDKNNEKIIDINTRLACDIHAHKILIYRNAEVKSVIEASSLLGSFVFLTTRHTWNKGSRFKGQLLIPEFELYESLIKQQRKIILYLRNLSQNNLDKVMESIVFPSTSITGSMSGEGVENEKSPNRWNYILGERSIGRFAVGSTRTMANMENNNEELKDELKTQSSSHSPNKLLSRADSIEDVQQLKDSGNLGVEIDVMIGQLTLRSRHLTALQSDIANHPDTKCIFGESTIQASMLENSENRQCYRLVGLNHIIQYWPDGDKNCSPVDDIWEREYDPGELFESERWIPRIWEPIRKSFF